MRLRDTGSKKHVHQWRLFTPTPDDDGDEQALLFDMPAPPDLFWTYRRCDCGCQMRCKTSALEAYPRDLRAYADEGWEPL